MIHETLHVDISYIVNVLYSVFVWGLLCDGATWLFHSDQFLASRQQMDCCGSDGATAEDCGYCSQQSSCLWHCFKFYRFKSNFHQILFKRKLVSDCFSMFWSSVFQLCSSGFSSWTLVVDSESEGRSNIWLWSWQDTSVQSSTSTAAPHLTVEAVHLQQEVSICMWLLWLTEELLTIDWLTIMLFSSCDQLVWLAEAAAAKETRSGGAVPQKKKKKGPTKKSTERWVRQRCWLVSAWLCWRAGR